MSKREIYEASNLTNEEIEAMPDFIEGNEEFYGTVAFEKLFDYFCFETAEMPYGVAKARTETPDVWILDYLEEVHESR